MQEQWRPVPVSEVAHIYSVSSYGQVRVNVKRNKNTYVGKLLKQTLRKDGYKSVWLIGENFKKNYLVHRLVAGSFINNDLDIDFNPLTTPVNHEDFNKSNNCLDNLKITTSSGNAKYSYDAGRIIIPFHNGEENGMAKLNKEQIIKIRFLKCLDFTFPELAKMFNVSRQTIERIVYRQKWRHVS